MYFLLSSLKWMVTGVNGKNGIIAAYPVEVEPIHASGSVTVQRRLMVGRNVTVMGRNRRRVPLTPVRVCKHTCQILWQSSGSSWWGEMSRAWDGIGDVCNSLLPGYPAVCKHTCQALWESSGSSWWGEMSRAWIGVGGVCHSPLSAMSGYVNMLETLAGRYVIDKDRNRRLHPPSPRYVNARVSLCDSPAAAYSGEKYLEHWLKTEKCASATHPCLGTCMYTTRLHFISDFSVILASIASSVHTSTNKGTQLFWTKYTVENRSTQSLKYICFSNVVASPDF